MENFHRNVILFKSAFKLYKERKFISALDKSRIVIRQTKNFNLNIDATLLRGCIYEKLNVVKWALKDFKRVTILSKNLKQRKEACYKYSSLKGKYFRYTDFSKVVRDKMPRIEELLNPEIERKNSHSHSISF